MSNLRSLIGYVDNSSFGSIVGLTTNYGSQYRQIRMYDPCISGTSPLLNGFFWRAPVGTSFINIELWGGGGSGAGGCCCMFGPPGGSGAYAYKSICSNDVGNLDGCPFEFCIGSGGCCSNSGSAPMVGYFGCKSYATGIGLCNFCAEGGGPGIAYCAYSVECCFCWDNTYSDSTGSTSSHGGAMDFVRNVYDYCGPHNINCGFSCFSSGGGIGNFSQLNQMGKLRSNPYVDRFGNARRFDSNCKNITYGHSVNHCYGGSCTGFNHCAPYYGADGGSFGLPGAITSPCNSDADDRCWIKQLIPYPGGLINTSGGYWRQHAQPLNMNSLQTPTFMNISMGIWSGGGDSEWGVPGSGGNTASQSGGNCYCGGPGSNGLIQITYGGYGRGFN